jgi:hypothetical protein
MRLTLMNSLGADMAAGLRAPVGTLVTGALVALAVTTALLIGLALLAPIGPGAAAAMVVPAQLGLTYIVAGRLARRQGETV